ncbi:hypothetical protein Btru_065909 [Bulinus truncatus]|nr:hypothetical protein Btru_065909 [Bulinus truncatus]
MHYRLYLEIQTTIKYSSPTKFQPIKLYILVYWVKIRSHFTSLCCIFWRQTIMAEQDDSVEDKTMFTENETENENENDNDQDPDNENDNDNENDQDDGGNEDAVDTTADFLKDISRKD